MGAARGERRERKNHCIRRLPLVSLGKGQSKCPLIPCRTSLNTASMSQNFQEETWRARLDRDGGSAARLG